VVSRLGVPWRPEVTMGALAEDGTRIIDDRIVEEAMVSQRDADAVERRERIQLGERVARVRGDRPPRMLGGRTAVIVDDGVATGASARVACQVARNRGAGHVILAVPVASEEGSQALVSVADELLVLQAPADLLGIGQAYLDFGPTDDGDVTCLLMAADGVDAAGVHANGSAIMDGLAGGAVSSRGAAFPALVKERVFQLGAVSVAGRMTVPRDARELVILVHDSSRQRHSARSRYLSRMLADAGLATLQLDLLTRDEEIHGNRYLAIPTLAGRLHAVTRTLHDAFDRIGYLADGVAAAIALEAAAIPDSGVTAVACLGGRLDLVARLGAVRAPVLLVVGERDSAVLRLNVEPAQKLSCPYRFVTIPQAGHRLREPGALQNAAADVRAWFLAPEDPRGRLCEARAAVAAR
jgi:putative phosphoribosyl transferase